jgi:hypothetical protein
MKAKTKVEIEELLNSLHHLSEGVIEQFSRKDYGTTLEVVFNYIWTDDQRLRSDLERPFNVALKFRCVQELHMNNALNKYMCAHPEEIGWGINEVAVVKAKAEEEAPEPYRLLFRFPSAYSSNM